MVDIYTWSHCSGEWQHFATLSSIAEAERLIKDRKYDPRYCKIEEKGVNKMECPNCKTEPQHGSCVCDEPYATDLKAQLDAANELLEAQAICAEEFAATRAENVKLKEHLEANREVVSEFHYAYCLARNSDSWVRMNSAARKALYAADLSSLALEIKESSSAT